MKNLKKVLCALMTSAIIFTVVGCSRNSTGSKGADAGVTAFNNMVKEFPSNKGFHRTLEHWGFKLPGNDKFEWTKDTSANKIDYAMVIQADPLIKAGLDPKKLDQKDLIFKPAAVEDGVSQANRIVHPYNVSDKKEISSGSEDAFRRVLKQNTSLVKYDKTAKDYMIILGNNYEVHWTEKLGSTNDDMEFVISAEPLIKAGLDTNKLDGTGWKLVKPVDGNSQQLVKIFALR